MAVYRRKDMMHTYKPGLLIYLSNLPQAVGFTLRSPLVVMHSPSDKGSQRDCTVIHRLVPSSVRFDPTARGKYFPQLRD